MFYSDQTLNIIYFNWELGTQAEQKVKNCVGKIQLKKSLRIKFILKYFRYQLKFSLNY